MSSTVCKELRGTILAVVQAHTVPKLLGDALLSLTRQRLLHGPPSTQNNSPHIPCFGIKAIVLGTYFGGLGTDYKAKYKRKPGGGVLTDPPKDPKQWPISNNEGSTV